MGGGDHAPARVEGNAAAVDPHVVAQPGARAHEVVAVVGRVEGDHVGAEEPLEHLGAPWQPREGLGSGEGDVQEERDRPPRAAAAQQVGQQHQVVVVHPADALARLVGRGEGLVRAQVGAPPVALVGRLLDEPVQERPERPVREAVVVVVGLAAAERHRAELDLQAVDVVGHAVAAALPAHPRAAARLERRLERGHEPAGRRAPAVARVRDREAIREREQRQVVARDPHPNQPKGAR